MSRFVAVPIGLALLFTGCVPVTAPIGDIDKAEPDKTLVGVWSATHARGTSDLLKIKTFTVDIPEVKGNPKGLMRCRFENADSKDEIWFYPVVIGKHTYGTVILGKNESGDMPKFGEEGGYAKWRKQDGQRYFIVRFLHENDRLILDSGNQITFMNLMRDAGIKASGEKYIEYFATPAGWLDKYLDKTGPAKLFDGANTYTLAKMK